MKKLLLIAFVLPFIGSKLNGQCTTPNQTITATFASLPSCWTLTAYAGLSQSKLRVTSQYQSSEAKFVLPMAVNAKGILNFVASNTTNGQQGYGNFTIGAMASPTDWNSFEAITGVNIYPTISGNYIVSKAYSVDLSSYTGTNQYIAFKMPGNTSYYRVINFISFDYESGCISSVVDAVAQDITIQLDNTGVASINTTQIDNGSNSDCDGLVLSLDKTSFDCTNIGANQVVLTAADNQNATDTAHATVTVLAAIDDEALTINDDSVCVGGSTTVNTASSINGINYWLRDNSNNSILDGPVVGSGNALSFNTGTINQASTYQVYAETKAPWTGLDFDGVNDKLLFNTHNRSITTQFTVSAWIKSPANSKVEIFLTKYDGANGYILYIDANGKLNLDGRDGSGGYKQSGASTTTVKDGTWHYVSGTANTSTGVWQVYVDGVLETTKTNAAGSSFAGNAVFGLGHHNNASYYTGEMDEVSIYNTVLNQASIQSYMNNCLNGTETNLVGLFNFNEGSGTTITDISPVATNGGMSGMDASDWISNSFSCGTTCDFTMSQTVDVKMVGQLNISTSEEMAIITADLTGASYQWLYCGNNKQVISNETAQTFSPGVNGSYAVELTKGCRVDTSDCVAIYTVGNSKLEKGTFTFFPNPTNGMLNLKLDNNIPFTARVFNLNGKLVLTSNETLIDVGNLPKGIYTMQILQNKELKTSSFVKK